MEFKTLSIERWFLLVFCVLAATAVAFMGQIVEPPKVLLGQMLTAITPSLFPNITLSVLAVLSGGMFLFMKSNEAEEDAGATTDLPAVWRGVQLFLCMMFYALAMEPIGFFLSSFNTIILVSLLTGNRSVLQIAILAAIGPFALYLMATRLLAVSLPELNAIELFYAQILGL